MRLFCEFLDGEANKRMTEVHESSLKQQEIKFVHALSSLKLLVHIYFLKQLQAHEDFLHNIDIPQPIDQQQQQQQWSKSPLYETDTNGRKKYIQIEYYLPVWSDP